MLVASSSYVEANILNAVILDTWIDIAFRFLFVLRNMLIGRLLVTCSQGCLELRSTQRSTVAVLCWIQFRV